MKKENKMRKKAYLVVLIIVFFSISAEAQIGIKLGMNINHIKYSHLNDLSFQKHITFQAGAFFTWKLSRKFSLQPELYYSRSGAKRSISFPDNTIIISEEFSYIRLSLLVKYMLLSKGNWSLSPLCGLYGAYNLTADQKVSYGDEERSDSIRELISLIDLGFISGLEIGYKTGKGILLLDFRFSLGLKNTSKNDHSGEKVYNRMIVVQLGYCFNI